MKFILFCRSLGEGDLVNVPKVLKSQNGGAVRGQNEVKNTRIHDHRCQV